MVVDNKKSKKIPVIILNGFLGSGKTTLFRNLLNQSRKKNINLCAIVNDMSELDVDGQLIGNTELVEENSKIMKSIHSCVLSSDIGIIKLDEAINDLHLTQDTKCLIIETSGSCHPLPIIKYFQTHENLKLTGLLALVDCFMMAHDFSYGEMLISNFKDNLELNKRDTINLLVEQILFSSHVIFTKSDRIETNKIKDIHDTVKKINPFTRMHTVVHGRLELESLLELQEYNYYRVERLIDELEPLIKNIDRPYELVTRVIHDDRPFHPERFWNICQNYLDKTIYRSKGFFWMASRDRHALLWNQAGGDINLEIVGTWKQSVLEDQNNGLLDEEINALKNKISKEKSRFGDRHCKLTVIGDIEKITQFSEKLNSCFLNEEEIKFWKKGGEFKDPWPKSIVNIN